LGKGFLLVRVLLLLVLLNQGVLEHLVLVSDLLEELFDVLRVQDFLFEGLLVELFEDQVA
jgi:hypothetical protein